MQCPGIVKQGLSPILAIGVITASIFTAVTNQPSLQSVESNPQGVDDNSQVTSLWQAGTALVGAPVKSADLMDVANVSSDAWVETRYTPATVGQVFGKLVVTRELGPSDEADATQIAQHPQAHLVAVRMKFKPGSGENERWLQARFMPNGKVLNHTGAIPFEAELAMLHSAHCSLPLPEKVAAKS